MSLCWTIVLLAFYLVGIVCIGIMAKIAPEGAVIYAVYVSVVCAALTVFVRTVLSLEQLFQVEWQGQTSLEVKA